MPGRKRIELPPLADRLATIHDRLMEIFRRSRANGQTPENTADHMAREIIGR
jgi:hypothetical protein